MDRYIGLDAHASSCTVAVIGPSGRKLQSQVLETNAKALISFLETIPKDRHLCLEEGTHANWLYEVLKVHVEEIVVAGVRQSRGPKSDKRDAFKLADELRVGSIEKRVYKESGGFAALRALSQAYTTLVTDSVRIQNRIKGLYRSRGIATSGRKVYLPASRQAFLEKLPGWLRPRGSTQYLELDAVNALKKQAAKSLLEEARRHKPYEILRTCPGLGPIRTAQLLSIVVTPYRFANKRSFWAYCGLAVVMRTSSDWARTQDGKWVWAALQRTRGLNRNSNHTLKQIFKGAAITVVGRRGDEPLYRHYLKLLDGGTKPNLAKLTIARQIASIALSLWRSKERYDPRRVLTS